MHEFVRRRPRRAPGDDCAGSALGVAARRSVRRPVGRTSRWSWSGRRRGLGAALALARQGRTVTVLERDATPLPADRRRGVRLGPPRAPPRCATATPSSPACATCCATTTRTCSQALLDAGRHRACASASDLPPTIAGFAPEPGDDDLVDAAPAGAPPSSGCCAAPRWPTGGSTIRSGRRPSPGLLGGRPRRGHRRAAGVRRRGWTADSPITAAVTVVAAGRRQRRPTWLTAIGAAPDGRGGRRHRHRLLLPLLPAAAERTAPPPRTARSAATSAT